MGVGAQSLLDMEAQYPLWDVHCATKLSLDLPYSQSSGFP